MRAWLESRNNNNSTTTTAAPPQQQEKHMRAWLESRDGVHASFEITFYPARFDVPRGSILPLGDTTKWCVINELIHY